MPVMHRSGRLSVPQPGQGFLFIHEDLGGTRPVKERLELPGASVLDRTTHQDGEPQFRKRLGITRAVEWMM